MSVLRLAWHLYVLKLPLVGGENWLSAFVFIGGLSAATSMVIVACMALSGMIGNELLMPYLLKRQAGVARDMGPLVVLVRRAATVTLDGYVTQEHTVVGRVSRDGIVTMAVGNGILGGGIMQHAALFEGHEMPYGWIGVVAAMHFGLWFYLGIEGTTQAAEEVRSPARALPFGTLAGIMTLLIAATLTWYICSGVLPWEFLGDGVNGSVAPLFDTARLSGSNALIWLLGIGTLFATLASANGCINDASRAWFALGRDKYLPAWFGAVHPQYRTPYRSIVFLVPIALIFALGAPLDQVITFSILSGLLGYTFMPLNILMFRKKWPMGTIKRGYEHPFHPIPAIVLLSLCAITFFAVFLGYGTQLVAMIGFYIVVSLWFHFWRYRFVNRGAQFTMPWPKPRGY